MKVTLKFTGRGREIIGKREETLDIEAHTSILEILRLLAEKHGSELREYLFDPMSRNPRQHLRFLLNGQSVQASQLIDAESVLLIFPPVGGG